MTYEQLFQVETAYEMAFQSILQNAGIEKVFRSRENREAQSPYVEVRFICGAVSEKRQHFVNKDTPLIYSGWFGSQLQFDVTTQRVNNGDQHKVLLGKIRLECQMFRLVQTWYATDAAERHAIADIRENNSVHTFDTENDIDMTTITFHLSHNLKDDAFPQ